MVKAFSRPGKIREFEKMAKIREFENTFWKNQGKKFRVPHMLYPCCDGVVHDFCVIVGGESVAITEYMYKGWYGGHI